MKYEFLEHTADAKFRAYGTDLEEKFSNSALAMFNIVTDTSKVKALVEKTIEVKANRLRTLLYEFLEEFVVLMDSEGWLLSEIKEIKIDPEKLRINCVALGDVGNYELETQIKSITYSDMELTEEYFQVVVDI